MPPAKDSIPGTTGNTSGSKAMHPLLAWTNIRTGAASALRLRGGQKLVGVVEPGTGDGLVIWIRTDMNERKMIHFHDCESVQHLDDEW